MSNIALCLFNYFPYGGLQRNFFSIAKALLDRGHDVHVFTGDWQGEKLSNIDIHELPRTGFSNAQKNARFSSELQAALAKMDVDLVVGFNKMPGLDLYYCADTCFATKAYEQRSWWYRMTKRSRQSLAYEAAVFERDSDTEILLLSAKEGLAFQKYYQTPTSRLHLIPPGIGKDRIRDEQSAARGEAIRQSLAISPDQKVICFIGSFFKTKGLDRLLSAFEHLPQETQSTTAILIVGQDKRQADFEKLAIQSGIESRTYFLGQRSDVPDCLFASDLLVHPARQENTGNVLLEAAVAGLPVICTDACGYAHYIRDHQLGVVLPEPFESDALEHALLDMLADETIDWQQRCSVFAQSADIYSRLDHIVARIEAMAAREPIEQGH